MLALLLFNIFRRALQSGAIAKGWSESKAVAVDTSHLPSHQGDTGTFLCNSFVLEKGKGLRMAFSKGTQMFVFIAPPELIKILTF